VKTKYAEQIRYLLIGGWNTLFGYGVYAVLYLLLRHHISYVAIIVPTWIVSITNAYLGYKFVVFRTRGNYLREYLKTYLVYGVAFLINLALLPVFVEVLGWSPLLGQAVVGAFTVVISYVAYKYFAFRPRLPGGQAAVGGGDTAAIGEGPQ
jgi:putative flippase GtrA